MTARILVCIGVAIALASLLGLRHARIGAPAPDQTDAAACKRARASYQPGHVPTTWHPLDEFVACRRLAADLAASATAAAADYDRAGGQSEPPAVRRANWQKLDDLAQRALAAYREACRYHDAPSCVSYGLLRAGGFPMGKPTPKDKEAGRSALRRGCKLAQMQADLLLGPCTGDARPVRHQELCEPDVDSLDEHRPHIGPCLDGSKAPPAPPPPEPR